MTKAHGKQPPEFRSLAEEEAYYRRRPVTKAMLARAQKLVWVPDAPPEPGPRSEVIKFRASSEEKARLVAAAERRGVTVAAFLRDYARAQPRPDRPRAHRRRSAQSS